MDTLRRLTRRLCAAPKGIIALDSPDATVCGRLRLAGLASNNLVAREFRTMILRTPALADQASGVVLRPEHLEQSVGEFRAPEYLWLSGVLAGVRVDTGHEVGVTPTAHVTSGLDSLADRLTRFRYAGAWFALWSVCTPALPDDLASLTVNSQAAARFARTCHNHGLVPVLRVGARMTASEPSARRAMLAAALTSLVRHLEDLEVDLAAVVVNTVSAADAGAEPQWGIPLTVLPQGLGGVALSTPGMGGPEEDPGEVRTRVSGELAPWPVIFCVGWEVTTPALRAWGGAPAGVTPGQAALVAGLKRVASRLPARHETTAPPIQTPTVLRGIR